MLHEKTASLLVVGDTGGITVIDPSTPLRRLNYFDGKYLRAADFNIEQGYLRHLVALSNQGLGPGVVYGYDTSLSTGDTVHIGPGLAIDPYGKVLLLQSNVELSIQELIDATKKMVPQAPDASGKTGPGVFHDCVEIAAPRPTAVVPVSDIYVIAICSAEALCGQQDVYGLLCQDACITKTDRPYRLDGIVVRAIPLQLVTPFPTSQAVAIGANLYLRSKVAHSWFADEVLKHPHAVSRDGLLSTTWCLGAGYDSGCCEVPLAVVARAGATTIFLDTWIVRRERMEAPAKRYWQWRMRMRPWDVFLAQILQFQCQLADFLSGIGTPGCNTCDPCPPAHQAINEAAQFIEQVRAGLVSYQSLTANETLSGQPALLSLSLTQISDLQEKLQTVLENASVPAQPKGRILIQEGMIETPAAAYLPVVNGTSVSVNDQVRALLGDGLDLRFCITTADYIAHAIEEAQHMDRISLLQGIDDPSNKPHVDVLVPDGVIASNTTKPGVSLYDANLTSDVQETGTPTYKGAAREEALCSGGTALYIAAAGPSKEAVLKLQMLVRGLEKTAEVKTTAIKAILQEAPAPLQEARMQSPPETTDGLWLAARTDQKIRALGVNGQTGVSGRAVLGTNPDSPLGIELSFNGTLSISSVVPQSITGTLNGILSLGLIRKKNQGPPITEYPLTSRFNWSVELTYTGDDAIGSMTLGLKLPENVELRLTRTAAGSSPQVAYQLALTSGSNKEPLGELVLIADADAINPGNSFHQSAESGLDLIQAALTASEPSFKPNAEARLFPALPVATQELTIQAVRDWVAFTRRREKKCHKEVVPLPPPPPPPPPPTPKPVVKRDAMLISREWLNDDPMLRADPPPVAIVFADGVPQGTGLQIFFNKISESAFGVTLATKDDPPDKGADERLTAVIEALPAAKKKEPLARKVETLGAADTQMLHEATQDPDTFAEVIFIELPSKVPA